MNGDFLDGNDDEDIASQQILFTTLSGSIALLTTLNEQTYRRVSTLQSHMLSSIDPTCGLNPDEYRNLESEGFGARGVIDGGLVLRGWAGMGARARSEASGKVGEEAWVLRGDLLGMGTLKGL